MNSQSIAGVLGATVATIEMVAAVVYGPIGQPAKPVSTQQTAPAPKPAPAAAAPRGPVIREVPN